MLTFVFLAFCGRLTDLLGVRRVAIVGVVGLPLCRVASASMTGPIWQYFAINVAVNALGVTTTPAVYSRIVAIKVPARPRAGLGDRDLGTATAGRDRSACPRSSEPCHGWWIGRLSIAAVIAAIGIAALMLVPPAGPPIRYSVTTSQLGVVLGDSVGSGDAVAVFISTFAVAVIVGRFVCGSHWIGFPPTWSPRSRWWRGASVCRSTAPCWASCRRPSGCPRRWARWS